MEKILFFEELYSNRRNAFIARAIELQNKGKNFLYILPSREASKDVKYSLLNKMGGLINSKVIMFDELELSSVLSFIDNENIIYEDMEKQIISDICKTLEIEFSYFEKIKNKEGFKQEVKTFIKYLKRNCINTSKLNSITEVIEDTIIKDKLQDLSLIYERYNKRLIELKVYDINDISLMAVEKILSSDVLEMVDTIFIDGFINIDVVNIELIKSIVKLEKLNIYVSCPYRSPAITDFIASEIRDVFKEIGFDINEETKEANIEADLAEVRERIENFERDDSQIAKNIKNYKFTLKSLYNLELEELKEKERVLLEKQKTLEVNLQENEDKQKAVTSEIRENIRAKAEADNKIDNFKKDEEDFKKKYNNFNLLRNPLLNEYNGKDLEKYGLSIDEDIKTSQTGQEQLTKEVASLAIDRENLRKHIEAARKDLTKENLNLSKKSNELENFNKETAKIIEILRIKDLPLNVASYKGKLKEKLGYENSKFEETLTVEESKLREIEDTINRYETGLIQLPKEVVKSFENKGINFEYALNWLQNYKGSKEERAELLKGLRQELKTLNINLENIKKAINRNKGYEVVLSNYEYTGDEDEVIEKEISSTLIAVKALETLLNNCDEKALSNDNRKEENTKKLYELKNNIIVLKDQKQSFNKFLVGHEEFKRNLQVLLSINKARATLKKNEEGLKEEYIQLQILSRNLDNQINELKRTVKETSNKLELYKNIQTGVLLKEDKNIIEARLSSCEKQLGDDIKRDNEEEKKFKESLDKVKGRLKRIVKDGNLSQEYKGVSFSEEYLEELKVKISVLEVEINALSVDINKLNNEVSVIIARKQREVEDIEKLGFETPIAK